MVRPLVTAISIFVTFASLALASGVSAARQGTPIGAHACDRLAASPSNQDNPASIVGVYHWQLDAAAAQQACEAAFAEAPNERRFRFQLARALSLNGGYDQARLLLEPLVEQNYAPALNTWGIMIEEGRAGFAADPELAATYYQHSGDAGFAFGYSNLALLYQSGVGVARNPELAAAYFVQAIALGDQSAQYDLGALALMEGVLEVPTTAQAVALIRDAAALGMPSALFLLGALYFEGEVVPKSTDHAWHWLTLADKAGDRRARSALDYLESAYDFGPNNN